MQKTVCIEILDCAACRNCRKLYKTADLCSPNSAEIVSNTTENWVVYVHELNNCRTQIAEPFQPKLCRTTGTKPSQNRTQPNFPTMEDMKPKHHSEQPEIIFSSKY